MKIYNINQKVDQFLEKSLGIKNKKFRKAIIVTLWLAFIVYTFGLWPFLLGIYLLLVIWEKIISNKLKYSLTAITILFSLLIGIPWARATYDEDYKRQLGQQNTETKNQQDQQQKVEENINPAEQRKKEKEEIKTEDISFNTTNKDDPSLEKGKTAVAQNGSIGKKEIKYKVTYTDGKETNREVVSEKIIVEPTDKIILIGTKVVQVVPKTSVIESKPVSNCDPNYSGDCVPIASDVDCAGGSGNGPAYVRGPVYVIGNDIYDLDRDGNGVACEN